LGEREFPSPTWTNNTGTISGRSSTQSKTANRSCQRAIDTSGVEFAQSLWYSEILKKPGPKAPIEDPLC
jgi:hypothetical protein